MSVSLFAGIPVRDFTRALPWYEALFGTEPTFLAHATEAVWEVAGGRSVYIDQEPEHAGHARVTVFVEPHEDLAGILAGISARGIEPAADEIYDNGVRKVTYRDEDGNEFGYGAGPAPE